MLIGDYVLHLFTFTWKIVLCGLKLYTVSKTTAQQEPITGLLNQAILHRFGIM